MQAAESHAAESPASHSHQESSDQVVIKLSDSFANNSSVLAPQLVIAADETHEISEAHGKLTLPPIEEHIKHKRHKRKKSARGSQSDSKNRERSGSHSSTTSEYSDSDSRPMTPESETVSDQDNSHEQTHAQQVSTVVQSLEPPLELLEVQSAGVAAEAPEQEQEGKPPSPSNASTKEAEKPATLEPIAIPLVDGSVTPQAPDEQQGEKARMQSANQSDQQHAQSAEQQQQQQSSAQQQSASAELGQPPAAAQSDQNNGAQPPAAPAQGQAAPPAAPAPPAAAPAAPLPPAKRPTLVKRAWLKFKKDIWNKLHFSSYSTGRQVWNLVIFVVVLYNNIVVPLRACFGLHTVYHWIVQDIFTDLFLYADIILGFFTELDKNGKPVVAKKTMAWNYIKSTKFWIDIASILPIDIFGYIFGWYSWFRVNRMLRTLQTNLYFDAIEKLVTRLNPAYIGLMKATYYILFASHTLGCGYFLVIFIQGENTSQIFLPGGVDLLSMNIWWQYVRCFYTAFVIMTGYTNTNTTTDLECAYFLLLTVVGLVLFVAIIGTAGSLISSLQAQQSMFQAKMDQITAFMKYRKLPMDIQQKVNRYYNYMWKTRKTLDEGAVLADLPVHLRTEVALSLYKELITKVPLFQKSSSQFIEEIVLLLVPVVSLPGSYIIRKDEIGREMYFIAKGSVDVVSPDGKIVFVTFNEGKFFGEIALLENTKRTANIRAKSYCDLFVIQKDSFDELMKRFPEEHEIIKDIAAQQKTQKK